MRAGCGEGGPKAPRALEGDEGMDCREGKKACVRQEHGLGLERAAGGLYRDNAVGVTELPGLDFTPHALAGNAIWGLIWNETPAVIPVT